MLAGALCVAAGAGQAQSGRIAFCFNAWEPYAYVEERLAQDFWTLLRPDWLDSGEFEQPLFE